MKISIYSIIVIIQYFIIVIYSSDDVYTFTSPNNNSLSNKISRNLPAQYDFYVSYAVDSIIDNASDCNYCKVGKGECNIRSALQCCKEELIIQTSLQCSINLPSSSVILINSTLDVSLSSDMTTNHLNIDINGNGSTITPSCIDNNCNTIHFLSMTNLYPSYYSSLSLSLSNLTIAGFANRYHDLDRGIAGAIYLSKLSMVNIFNVNFIHNRAVNGAAIYFDVENKNVNIDNCLFYNNTATEDHGGAIYANMDNSYVAFYNSTFFDNLAVGYGGAINIDNGNNYWTFTQCKFANNTGLSGGAFNAISNNKHLTFTSCDFINNSGNVDGGALRVESYNTYLSIHNCNFRHNYCASRGGAVLILDGNDFASLTKCHYDNNIAGYGAGALISGSKDPNYSVRFDQCMFIHGYASDAGGGLYTLTNQAIEITNSSFYYNNATFGGAICAYDKNVDFYAKNCTLYENFAVYGGAFYINSNNFYLSFENIHFIRNIAISDGGGLFAKSNNYYMVLHDIFFSNNSALTYNGGMNILHYCVRI